VLVVVGFSFSFFSFSLAGSSSRGVRWGVLLSFVSSVERFGPNLFCYLMLDLRLSIGF